MLLVCLTVSFAVQAQDKVYTAKEALQLVKEEKYVEAEQAYAQLLQKYDREPRYNYYYGICLLQNNKDIPHAVKRLKYAALKGVSRDTYYYLGRAYQLGCEFDEALKNFNRYMKYASGSDGRKEKAVVYMEECQAGKEASAKIYNLTVYRRDTTTLAQLLEHYHPVKDVGEVLRNKDFFESGLDPEGLLYLTERGDEVYFSMADDEDGGKNLYKMEKLLDGWGDSNSLDAVNSDANDVYPFLQIDGATLYFASDRPGGLGGYDIYTTTYDAETKSFDEPVNMGIPFNSPKDDLLFVTDEFNSSGWFASNRETANDQWMVYHIKWDDSVVKNVVMDMNQVKIAVNMPLADDVSENGGVGVANGNGDPFSEEEVSAAFSFMIADTIVYTEFSHFNNDEARAAFEQGLGMEHQKDSLSLLMGDKREAYARSNVETEQAKLVNEILALEKEVYGLDGQIENYFFTARRTEQGTIRELVKTGRYQPPVQVKVERKDDSAINGIFIPGDFTYYTNDEFTFRLGELDSMYQILFYEDEIRKLKHADSLYVWGNILTLEASKMLEQSSLQPETGPVISSPFKKKDSLAADESPSESMVKKSRELKVTALKLYHKSLNEKYELYRDKIKEVVLSEPTTDFTFLDEPQGRANAYFRKANEYDMELMGFDLEKYERAGAMKRSGVSEQEASLFAYLEYAKGTAEVVKKTAPKGKVQKTYQELHKGDEAVKSAAATTKRDKVKAASTAIVYKIQIGVFRNEPNKAALSLIPTVSTISIPEKGLTKYYAGRYDSYKEAQQMIDSVRKAGFTGAFVVAFKGDKQINLSEELKK
ncbi:MAG: PD40 domain-containing protein [Marinilabiliaceae bacterium]|nr:PD40 domain-containing protein [Marinilabiliaceae bacterium]